MISRSALRDGLQIIDRDTQQKCLRLLEFGDDIVKRLR